MTQPIRLKVTARSTTAEKPPSFGMKDLVKRMLCKCIPCMKSKYGDDKLPLAPKSLTSSEFDE